MSDTVKQAPFQVVTEAGLNNSLMNFLAESYLNGQRLPALEEGSPIEQPTDEASAIVRDFALYVDRFLATEISGLSELAGGMGVLLPDGRALLLTGSAADEKLPGGNPPAYSPFTGRHGRQVAPVRPQETLANPESEAFGVKFGPGK